ncbi:MAG TPA: hypothetical protein VMW78_02510 [Anaerolineae bacterium]|nr:hypothetical protein [Anaerolineae bacterium]
MAPEKNDQIKNIFKPGTQVVLMIEQNFLSCTARNAVIYDCDHSKQEIIVSSGEPMITHDRKKQKIFLTTLVNSEIELNARFGVRVEIEKIIENYELQGGEKVAALQVKYTPPLEKTTLREAFRMQPNYQFGIEGSINDEHHSGEECFLFDNISLTGAGIIVQKKGKGASLLDWEKEKKITIKMELSENNDKEEKVMKTAVTAKAEINRVNFYHSEKNGFIGIRFTKMASDDTRKLTAFITAMQLHNIRRKNRPV